MIADVRNLPIREDAILEFATRSKNGESAAREGGGALVKKDSALAFNSVDLELKFEIKEVF